MKEATEILLSAAQVTPNALGSGYEFILNADLTVLECIKIESMRQGIVTPIKCPSQTLEGMLFELNHVRVNPRLDNQRMVEVLTHALEGVGVKVLNRPHRNSMAVCHRPLGEITDNVRLYVGNLNRLVFLSPSPKKLRLISSRP
jgi:hypothetical protein